MHILQLKLDISPQDVRSLNKRFYKMNHIHNTIVKYAQGQIKALKSDPKYIELLQKRKTVSGKQKEHINAQLKEIRLQYGLSESQIQAYAKVCGRQFSKYLSSQQVQKEATRVWGGISECIFGKGKYLHFKKCNELTSIQGKTNTNGVKFDKSALKIEWQGLNIWCKCPKRQKDIQYLEETLN